MDDAMALAALFFIAIVIGAVLGWIAFFKLLTALTEQRRLVLRVKQLEIAEQDSERKITALREKYKTLESKILESKIHEAQPQENNASSQESTGTQATGEQTSAALYHTEAHTSEFTDNASPAEPSDNNKPQTDSLAVKPVQAAAGPVKANPQKPIPPKANPLKPSPLKPLVIQHLMQYWMVWLGGLCVALAGVFLAKYSMEQGLLGPGARIALGLATGVGLHVAAWRLRERFQAHAAFAALAGGGSITLFATLLAALHLYQLLSPLLVFGLLALVALATMWLALQHGPVLAAIGMLGAYSVPVLISTGSGNVLAALVYSLIISASVLMLMRYVRAPWLWWGLLAGALGWWALSLLSDQANGWRGVYLALFCYSMLVWKGAGWWLNREVIAPVWPLGDGLFSWRFKSNQSKSYSSNSSQSKSDQSKFYQSKPHDIFALSILCVVAAYLFSAFSQGASWPSNILNWGLLPVFLLFLAGLQPRWAALSWLLFLGQWLASLLAQLHFYSDAFQFAQFTKAEATRLQSFFFYVVGITVLFSGFAWRNFRIGHANHWWASLLVAAPVLSLLQLFLLSSDALSDWQWAFCALVFGASYVALAVVGVERKWSESLSVWLFLFGHFAYSLAAAFVFEQASLTLALALQIVSIAWLMQRFGGQPLGWIFKGVLTLVVVRLTLNPWLEAYPASGHWPLWTYGGATLCSFIAMRLLKTEPLAALRRWAELAVLHLWVLTLWAQTRYWLHDGAVFTESYTFNEAVLNMLLFGAMALVYHLKASGSQTLQAWYQGYSRLQLGFAGLNYLALVITAISSAPWAVAAIGPAPIVNILLVAYGLPVLLGALLYRFYEPPLRLPAAVFCAVAAFVFVTLEIRHLWQGTIHWAPATSVGELYTYSIVWLLMAVATMLAGSWRLGPQCYKAGLALLMLVIAKIFFVDMAGLDGLLRVASFMGLGFALLAVAFLHQKLSVSD